MNIISAYNILNLDYRIPLTDEQIRKKYIKLAKQFHPDKNGNSDESTDRFKEINNAYSFIKTYNQEPSNEDFISIPASIDKLFQSVFNNFGFHEQVHKRTDDRVVTNHITLEDYYQNKIKTIKIEVLRLCNCCSAINCRICNNNRCIKKDIYLKVNCHEKNVAFEGSADHVPGYNEYGDIIVNNEFDDPRIFNYVDIILECDINVYEFLFEIKKEITHPNGKSVNVVFSSFYKYNDLILLHDFKGLCVGDGYGKCYVKFNLVMDDMQDKIRTICNNKSS